MKDSLARKIYAQKIADEISDHYDDETKAITERKKKIRENIIFAISGKWGEGKTALLDLLEEPLKSKGFEVIRFNPWKYSQQDITLKRAFLGSVRKQLEGNTNLDDLYFDRTKTTLNFINWEFVAKYSVIGAIFYIYLIPGVFDVDVAKWISTTGDILNLIIAHPLVKALCVLILVPFILPLIKIDRKSAAVSTAEQFEEKFEDLLKNKRRIVIFIDDLDRCNSKTVKIILDSLKTFFQHPECSYVITGDHTVVERYAGDELDLPEGTKQSKKFEEGRRFLKKLFDVYWRLPLPTPYQFDFFVEGEIKSSKIDLNQQQLSNLKSFLIDDGLFERNPRHVKRFITKLRFALQGVALQKKDLEKNQNSDHRDSEMALKDILDNPDLLAKVLLLEEFFYPVYEKLILHPEEIVYHEKLLRGAGSPSDLKIKEKKVLGLLDENDDDLNNYAGLVKKSPKFTDEENSTVHEVANYFSFSGSTGLPSAMGPDEANFAQYLRVGKLTDKLGPVLSVAKKDKNKFLAERALNIFDAPGDPSSRVDIARDGLRLSKKLDDWSDRTDEWVERVLQLPLVDQKSLYADLWGTVLHRRPHLVEKVSSVNPSSLDGLWDILPGIDETTLAPESLTELERLVVQQVSKKPLDLKGVEIYIKKLGSGVIENTLERDLVDLNMCRNYLEHLESIGLLDEKLANLVKNKIRNQLKSFDNLDWANANKEFLKKSKIFDDIRTNISSWMKDPRNIAKIVDSKSSLELNDEDVKKIVVSITHGVKRSSDLSFLNHPGSQSLLQIDDKKQVFEELKLVVLDIQESQEKRKTACDFLKKENSLWSGLTLDDVYASLKSLRKARLSKFPEIREVVEGVLTGWGYDGGNENKIQADSVSSNG